MISFVVVFMLTDIEKKFASNIGKDVLVCGSQKGINLGLYFPECWYKEGILKPNGVNVFFPDKNKVYVQNIYQVKLTIDVDESVWIND